MNLRLIPLAESHLERVRVWRTSDEVSRHMFTDPVITPEAQRAWYRSQVLGNPEARWWILESDGVPIGLANVTGIDRANLRCTWGYYIGDPSHRGRGVGSRLAWTIHDYVFDVLGMNRLVTEVLDGNEAGLRLPASMGCTREGVLRQHVLKRGEFRDVVVFGILAGEWRKHREGLRLEPIPVER